MYRNYLVLWPTSRCNLKCKYCYAFSDDHRIDMDFVTAQKAVDTFCASPLKIQFAGGEPLLNFDLIRQVTAYVQNRGCDAVFQLQTNGTLIDTVIAKAIKRMRIRTGVSLDGPIGINEVIRGGTKQALEGIQYLAEAGVSVNLNSTVTAQNVDHLPELIDLAVYLGNVRGIGLDLVRIAGRACGEPYPVPLPEADQLTRALWAMYEKTQSIYRTTGMRVSIRPIDEARRRLSQPGCNTIYCYASCGSSYVVLPDGAVYPCGTLHDQDAYYMGNIHEGKVSRMALPSPSRGEGCAACDFRDVCPGGCPSRAITNPYALVEGSLDCILRKTAFTIVQSERSKDPMDTRDLSKV